MADADAAGFRDEIEFLTTLTRWVRVLFERERAGSETQASRDRGTSGESSPASVRLAGAPAPERALWQLARQIRDEIEARAAARMSNDRPCPLARLRDGFSLSPIELDYLLIAAVYECDPYLHTRYAQRAAIAPGTRLSIGYLARLAHAEWAEALGAARACLDELSPLRYYRLLVVGQADQGPGMTGRSVEAHARVVDLLTGRDAFPDALRATARAVSAPGYELPYPSSLKTAIARAWHHCDHPGEQRRLVLTGTDRGGKEALLGDALAPRPVLSIDVGRLVKLYQDADAALRDHLQEAVLSAAVPYLDLHDNQAITPLLHHTLSAAVAALPRACVIGCDTEDTPIEPGRRFYYRIPGLDGRGRAKLWGRLLDAAGCPRPAPAVITELGHRYALDHDAIRASAEECAAMVAIADDPSAAPRADDLHDVARRRQNRAMGAWSMRVDSPESWDDLIISDQTRRGLDAMLRQIRHADTVFGQWGFGRRWADEMGVSALFFGPPGTGKSMAVSLLARSLERELYRVDLSRVTSHWVGETEKNLSRLFECASSDQAILLFDEADSLFARRTDVRTSTDRYANLGVNYLLQKLDEFDGTAILTTNSPGDIDRAFIRRLRFHVEFPLPDVELRTRLWASMIPAACEVAGELDFRGLATRYKMGGGHIKNAILRAAFAAADRGMPLDSETLCAAAEEEYRNLGKNVWSPRRG